MVQTGRGFNANPATLDAHEVAAYAGQAKAQSLTDFLMHIIPNTIVDAFAKGDILEVLFVALLFGFALSAVGSARQAAGGSGRCPDPGGVQNCRHPHEICSASAHSEQWPSR